MGSTSVNGVLRRAAAGMVTALLVFLTAAPASAHGGGEAAVPARTLVLTALTYLANQPPGYMDVAMDKVGDALESEDADGVDLAQVKAAQKALAGDDMMSARALLQASLRPVMGPVTGADTGTTTVLEPLPGATHWTAADAVVAALAAGGILVGTALAWWWRPPMNLRALRRRVGTLDLDPKEVGVR